MFAIPTLSILTRFRSATRALISRMSLAMMLAVLFVSHAASAAVSTNLITLVDSAAGRYLLGETTAGNDIVRALLGSAGLVSGDVSPVLAKLAEPA